MVTRGLQYGMRRVHRKKWDEGQWSPRESREVQVRDCIAQSIGSANASSTSELLSQ